MKKRLPLFRILPLLTLMLGMVAVAAVPESSRQALRQLIQRAEKGDAKAIYDLGVLHDTGYDTIPVDSARSTALYRLSAEKGYAPAQNYLGFRYFNGEYIKQDVDSALYWLAKAAGNGDVKAANNLGFLLSNSDVVTRDYKQAIYWLTMATEAGLPAAAGNLADLYRQGLGTPADTVVAEQLYNMAIEGGLPDADKKLLNMMGPIWKNIPGDSAVELGKYYYLRQAPAIGIDLFENAAKQGNIDALALLGDAYSRAIGVEYDHLKSVEYFLKAALNGHPSAQFVIGELLEIFPDALSEDPLPDIIVEHFEGFPPSFIYDPTFWYEKAAENGVNDAQTATDFLFSQ